MPKTKSTKVPCPKHASTKYGPARYVHLCDACVALNRPADANGNKVRREGVDRCACGSKYWENDRCVDCGSTEPEATE